MMFAISTAAFAIASFALTNTTTLSKSSCARSVADIGDHGLMQIGKMENVKQELKRMKVNILELYEIR